MTSEQQKRKPKQSKIRYTEYYDLQSIFDSLYADSLNGKTFQNLMRLIASEENIKLAYRTIKGNKGSGTPGVDKRTIKDLAALREEQYVRLIQKQFSWYTPRPVKRVEIPKPNGKTRPLGIPTIVDRIVQQCILQVLEPICEAKFHERSNGFRPNRSTEHAIAQCCRLMQVQHLHYAVDIDIRGFFDNVSHGKLIRQMWEMGIRDKKLLCIVKQMLKAQVPEVTGFGEAAIPLFTKARIAAINHLGVVNGQTVAGYERAIRLETEKYTIFISPVQTWSTGKTNVETLTGTPNKFTSEKPAYLITLNLEKQTASISVHGAVFAPAMEDLGLVIEFRDVPFIATANGEIRLSRTETFDPYHDNAPNAGFPISNLTSTWNLFKGIDIAFTCDAKGGSYRVAADMPYYVATEK